MVMKSYNAAYSIAEFRKALRKGDFDYLLAPDKVEAFRTSKSRDAFQALDSFCGPSTQGTVHKFHLRKKDAYRVGELHLNLIVRKLAKNIRRSFKAPASFSRTAIVSNLCHFLSEGVKYRIYRLDIKSFYESFDIDDVKEKVRKNDDLHRRDRELTFALLDEFRTLGGRGLPRGMAISSCLSDLMMSDFDASIQEHPEVCYYGRYVDDIVIVSTSQESKARFKSQLVDWLPKGLCLNHTKQRVRTVERRCRPKDLLPTERALLAEIEYLGYKLSVSNPLKNEDENNIGLRHIRVDIADSKIKKIKSRIIRSLRDYAQNRNDGLLFDRISFLTSNYGVIDRNTGRRQLAGIFFNYPLLSVDTLSLQELDRFLRSSICMPRGRFNSNGNIQIPSSLKRELLRCSFVSGHRNKKFRYFNGSRYKEVRIAWRFE